MTNNLTNNIISNLTLVNSDNNEANHQIDLKTIVHNAKNDKTFHKLLIICIKYDIHLFNQSKNNYSLLTIENLLEQINNKQKIFTLELSNEIKNINNEWLLNIDNIFNLYKKKLKDLELISYILKNIFNNNILQKLCCISNTENSTENALSPTQKDLTDKKKKENISKYIAVYSN